MKRSLTSDILQTFSATKMSVMAKSQVPGKVYDPSNVKFMIKQSLSRTNSDDSNGSANKRRRSPAYDGESRAVELLCSRISYEKQKKLYEHWDDLDEFFQSLRIDGQVKAELTNGVLKLKKLFDSVEGMDSVAMKRKLAKFLVKGLIAMTEEVKAIEAKQDSPAEASTLDAELELHEKRGNAGRTIDLHRKICHEYIRVLTQVLQTKGEVDGLVENFTVNTQNMLLEAEKMLVVARAENKEKERVASNTRKGLEEVDVEISSHIAKNRQQDRSTVVSLCLDAVLSPNPEMAALITKRKDLANTEVKAQNDFTASQRMVSLIEKTLQVLRIAAQNFEKMTNASVTKGSAYRSSIHHASCEGLLKQIPKLAQTLLEFIQFQKERTETANQRALVKRKEIEEHERLYGDEAPTELRELKKRLAEFQGIQQRSIETLMDVANGQKELWVKALQYPSDVVAKETIAKDFEKTEDNDNNNNNKIKAHSKEPISVLPSHVVLRLQRCFTEIIQKIGDEHAEFSEIILTILKESGIVAPIRKTPLLQDKPVGTTQSPRQPPIDLPTKHDHQTQRSIKNEKMEGHQTVKIEHHPNENPSNMSLDAPKPTTQTPDRPPVRAPDAASEPLVFVSNNTSDETQPDDDNGSGCVIC